MNLSVLMVIMMMVTFVNAAIPQRMLDRKNGKGTEKNKN